MVRIITINKFVNNRNRLLFRWPVHVEKLDCRCKEFSTSAMSAGNTDKNRLLSDQFHLVNNIGHRFYSSSRDGNVTGLSFDEIISKKKKKISRTEKYSALKTSVTEVLKNSSHVKQESVGLIRKKGLERFVQESLANNTHTKIAKNQSDIVTMDEKPILFTPDDFQFDAVKHKKLMENIQTSFERFTVEKAKLIPNIDERSAVDSRTTTKSENLNDELQKNFQPGTLKFQASMKASLQAYINACVTVGMADRAFSLLNEYRRKTINGEKYKINDPELFTELMAKYAMGKNLQKVKRIYSIMLEENVSITPQVYMLMLSCMGRSPGNNKLIKDCIEKAAQKNISMNDIMDKSKFTDDHRSFVLEAIRRYKPNFVPVYTPPNVKYDNELLNFLNINLRNIEEKPQSLIEDAEKCKISKPKAGFSPEQLDKFSDEQFASENVSQIYVKNIQMLDSKICANARVKTCRTLLDKLLIEWREQTIKALKQRLKILQHKMRINSTKHMNIYPFLSLLSPDELTDMLIDEIKGMAQGSEYYSQPVFHIYSRIGKKVFDKHQLNVRRKNGVNDKMIELYKIYAKILCSGQCSENPRQLWQRIVHQSRGDGPCLSHKNINWPWQVEINVGRTLFKTFAETILINANTLKPNKPFENARVIYSVFINRDLRSREEIRLHPVFMELYREAKFDTIKFNSNEIPMFCPPIPWTSIDNGGYLISHSSLIRLPYDCRKQIEMIRKAAPRQLYPPLDSLNYLGCIAWKINTKILDLAIKIFNSGGNEKLHVPLTPDNRLTGKQMEYLSVTRDQLAQRKKTDGYNYVQNQKDLFSLYSDTLYKLSLANHFRDRPFFLPQNMDFRGRTYPIPPHLTHLSADLNRSMLMFHQKQPLGPFGLDWLKLHCVNLTGLKKRDSVQDRLIFAESSIDNIIDSADNPLDGRQWWLNSDDPWQTLAACMEIANAIRSPDPASYMSSFPIHQDGSCNGLQHFAALGRDVEGAYSVNLAPAETPQDVYATISNRVEEWRRRDAKLGNEIALALDGLVNRKTIKQTVMTTVYGVTRHGAVLQIRKQLKNIGFNPKLIDRAAIYLATATFGSLSETFKSARKIQDWFGECASAISKQNNQHVEWVSPLGLPIIQPYTRKINGYSSNARLGQLSAEGPLNTMKEKNAFSPNFIHSLDTCHMMMTALNCERAGITFVSVHDCFWTHANAVPIMSRICREQFVLLHSQPILENLGESFQRKFKSVIRKQKRKSKANDNKDDTKQDHPPLEDLFRAVPEKGKFDLKKVLESVYFFS